MEGQSRAPGRRALVAAHRGSSRFFPENTMPAFRSAVEVGADMVELDLHMTKDGEIVLMHDHSVDRTTDGSGPVSAHTLAELRRLDAGGWKAPAFSGERIPDFEAFLCWADAYPALLFNVELKDYPEEGREAWAYESARKSLALMERHGIAERSVINSWSGKLLEHIDSEYGGRYRLHGYYPFFQMGECARDPFSYLYCACLFHVKQDGEGKRAKDADPVSPREDFDRVLSRGVQPWVFYPKEEPETMARALSYGARLFTCNDPARAIQVLRELDERDEGGSR